MTEKSLIPVTPRMRRDLDAALNQEGAPTGGEIEMRTQGRVKRQTVSRVRRDPTKQSITWGQWRLLAHQVGLAAKDYLPPPDLSQQPPPPWIITDPLWSAIPNPRDRRIIERALRQVYEAGRRQGVQDHQDGDTDEAEETPTDPGPGGCPGCTG